MGKLARQNDITWGQDNSTRLTPDPNVNKPKDPVSINIGQTLDKSYLYNTTMAPDPCVTE
jgi:hypothetical protein